MAGEETEERDVEEYLKQLRQGYQVPLKIRARDLEIPVRLLTAAEQVVADGRAQKRYLAIPEDERSNVALLMISRQEMLFEASKDAEGMPALARPFLTKLSWDELAYLYDELMNQWDRVNPRLDEITQDELDALIDGAKKNPASLNELTFPQLLRLASQLLGLQEEADSPTDRPSGPS